MGLSASSEVRYRASILDERHEREAALEGFNDTLMGRVNRTDTLIERVDKLFQVSEAQPEWGSPRLSTTPTSLAIRELCTEIEVLRDAVRELACEVQTLSGRL